MLLKTSASGRAFELHWRDAPSRTQSFVVTVEEAEAPGQPVRWLRYDVPPTVHDLKTDETEVGLAGAQEGDAIATQDRPWRFRLFALDEATLQLGEGASFDQVRQRMRGHVLDSAELLAQPGAATPVGRVQEEARQVFLGTGVLYGLGFVALVVVGLAGIFVAPLLGAAGVVLLMLWALQRAGERRKRRLLRGPERERNG